ncbi:MFS transporter [Fodinisporobacter ferrooxydans]|uniref:MFS transporter n=1 Tax=Fodinisporobacter ferrooxydans TaxID=2901836 RepID=A0ABY4CIQ9_9BACL|nr:MFS transporter [Alicyclobacillaceae bacterium MYW30-H2]
MSHLRQHSSKGQSDFLPLQTVRDRNNYHWFVVGTVCVGAFMAALDASIINIALPVLKKQFSVRMHIVEWVSLVYLLTLAGLIVPFGRIADIMGRRWMYTLGFTVFIIGSLLCGLSFSLSFLLVSRVIQAVGAAMLQANSVSIVTAATPASDRGKAIGIQASAQGIGLSLGPAIGGLLLSFSSWHWIFYVNVPIGIIGTTLGVLFLPKDKKAPQRERFDYLGAVILSPSLVALLYFLNMGFKEGWSSPRVVGSYFLFALGMISFLWVERKSEYPMVDLSLFKKRIFALGSITGVLSFAVMYAILLLTPFYLDNVQAMSPLVSGMYLTIIPIGMTLFTPIAGIVADRYGTRIPAVIGMLAACTGCLSLSFMNAQGALPFLVPGLFLVGAGVGLFTPPNNSSVMGSVASNRLGIAGGILNMSRTLGMGLGITIGGLSYQLFLSMTGSMDENAAMIQHMILAFRWSFIAIACIAACTLLIAAVRHK